MQRNRIFVEILYVSLHPFILLYAFSLSAKPLFSGSNPDAASNVYLPPTRKIRAAMHVARFVKFILTHPKILMIPDGNMTGIMTQHNGR